MIGFGNIVDEIKNRCNYKGLCPFHNEKTPSFVVSDTKQIFTCFGCGATGDVIAFIQKYDNLDFLEAVEKLAGEYGIEVKDKGLDGGRKRKILYEINREAAAFFYKNFTKEPNPGYEYMKKRGIGVATLRKFGVGYADESWDSLYKYLTGKGIDAETLIELGLISQSKDKYYDKFRNRVIFPIINTGGKVIGFGGRALGDEIPKYLNSPESQVFQKKNNLFGLNLTRQDINKENYGILVEGYMDVISLYQKGIRNVSASLGTALTENQAALLKRYTENIILAYDGDEAGKNATLRGLDIFHKGGCKPKVMEIPDNKDPDDYIKNYGKDAFLKLVHEAMPFADYKIHLLRQSVDMNTTEGSVTFLQEVAKILKELSPVEADVYIKKIAFESKISEGAIRLEIYGNTITENSHNSHLRRYGDNVTGLNKKKTGMASMLEKNLIKLMLLNSSFIPRIKPYSRVFTTATIYKIYELIQSMYQEGEEIDIKKLEDGLETDENKILQDIIDNIQVADKEEQVFKDCIARIEATELKRMEREIIKKLSVLNDEKDKDQIEELTLELMDLQKIKNRR
jgi:DNA primase